MKHGKLILLIVSAIYANILTLYTKSEAANNGNEIINLIPYTIDAEAKVKILLVHDNHSNTWGALKRIVHKPTTYAKQLEICARIIPTIHRDYAVDPIVFVRGQRIVSRMHSPNMYIFVSVNYKPDFEMTSQEFAWLTYGPKTFKDRTGKKIITERLGQKITINIDPTLANFLYKESALHAEGNFLHILKQAYSEIPY